MHTHTHTHIHTHTHLATTAQMYMVQCMLKHFKRIHTIYATRKRPSGSGGVPHLFLEDGSLHRVLGGGLLPVVGDAAVLGIPPLPHAAALHFTLLEDEERYRDGHHGNDMMK